MVLGEVEEGPPDHHRRQVEEVADGLGFHVGQRPVQPEHGVLEHVAGLLPPPQVRVPAEQLAGQLHEPVAGVVDEGGVRRAVPGQRPVDVPLELGVGPPALPAIRISTLYWLLTLRRPAGGVTRRGAATPLCDHPVRASRIIFHHAWPEVSPTIAWLTVGRR